MPNILACAPVSAYDGFNGSIQRVEALRELGHAVEVVDSTVPDHGWPATLAAASRRLFVAGLPVPLAGLSPVSRLLRQYCAQQKWDLLWLDKGLAVSGDLLQSLKRIQPDMQIVGYSPDDMAARHCQSRQFLQALPYYDLFITTKSFNVEELQRLGCPRVEFVENSFDPRVFRPLNVSPRDAQRLGASVGFIGSYEEQRAASLHFLAKSGLQVRVWGSDWERCPFTHENLLLGGEALFGDDFARACGSTRINLCFLRKMNRDLQTTRSVEIPACGGFMLAERTAEHQALFREGVEAEYFSDDQELLAKCRHYLAHDDERGAIASAGYRRCIESDYTHSGRLRPIITRLLEHR